MNAAARLLLVTLPIALLPLAVWGGEEAGKAFVLYRAPKALAVQLAAWVLITVAMVSLRQPWESFRRLALRPPALLLGLFVAWSALTGFWASAPALWRPNLLHWITPLLAAIALAALLEEGGPELRRALVWGLCLGAAGLSLLALVQALGGLPFLAPIDPEIAKAWPATLGWKNPAAHWVAFQLFLLALLALKQRSSRRRVFLLTALALEVVYLVSLQSRTAMAGVLVGALVVAAAAPRLMARKWVFAALGMAALAAICGFALSPAARERIHSVAELVASPSGYLATDRGQYLRSTLNMARAHPFGVGLGNWQAEYPVHRVSSFGATAEFEVRRAHSDWVQALGEVGYLGLAIWATFWVALLREAWKARTRLEGVLLLGQLATMAVCGLTDYVVEMPLFRFQLAILVALAIARPPEFSLAVKPPASRLLALVVVAMLAILQLSWAKGTVIAADREARIQALASGASLDRQRVFELAEELRRLPKASATEHRAFLFVASLALQTGDTRKARRYLDLARSRSPWDPIGFELQARLERQEGRVDLAERWQRCREILQAPSVVEHPSGCEVESE